MQSTEDEGNMFTAKSCRSWRLITKIFQQYNHTKFIELKGKLKTRLIAQFHVLLLSLLSQSASTFSSNRSLEVLHNISGISLLGFQMSINEKITMNVFVVHVISGNNRQSTVDTLSFRQKKNSNYLNNKKK